MKIATNVLPKKPENCVFANYDDYNRGYFCMLGKRMCCDTWDCEYLEVKNMTKGAWCHEGED